MGGNSVDRWHPDGDGNRYRISSLHYIQECLSLLKSSPLKATSAVMKTVNGEKVPVLRELEVSVRHNGQDLVLPLLVMMVMYQR